MSVIAVALVLSSVVVADAIVTTKYGYEHDNAGFYGSLFVVLGAIFVFLLIREATK